MRAFSSCGKQGLLYVVMWASHCSDFSYCGAQALDTRVSIVAAHRLGSGGMQALGRAGFSSCGTQAQ